MQHLICGPRNARNIRKTIQNEVKCLDKVPHFALIADEITSDGQEILSMCLSLLDSISDPSKPTKIEVLIDLYDLKGIITGIWQLK